MSDVVVDNSPEWWPILQAVQLSNFCSIAAVAVVWYDYSLLFTREVNHIWRTPWSVMSSLYVIVRYLGMILAMCVQNICDQSSLFNVFFIQELFHLQCEYIYGTFNVCFFTLVLP
ncbi:hypothetical protein EDB19DRAFT_779128 [Suillus lakei]|nr:hypothetical protein EDB19DRAFT_779128 [Suillus lakei]